VTDQVEAEEVGGILGSIRLVLAPGFEARVFDEIVHGNSIQSFSAAAARS
jgi:hypothetical protein